MDTLKLVCLLSSSEYQLIAFDIDGTLVGSDDGRVVWQFLNVRFGSSMEENVQRFTAYLKGEITYAQWVDLDIGKWVDVKATRDQVVEEIRAHLFLNQGAKETVMELKRRGYKMMVISGSLDLTIELLFPEHPFEEVLTNRIWFDEQGFIAGWEATPYDMVGKAKALEAAAKRHQIPIAKTVFVGDHVNDLQVMEVAGLAVAFEPKDPSVRNVADVVIQQDLRQLLDILPRRKSVTQAG